MYKPEPSLNSQAQVVTETSSLFYVQIKIQIQNFSPRLLGKLYWSLISHTMLSKETLRWEGYLGSARFSSHRARGYLCIGRRWLRREGCWYASQTSPRLTCLPHCIPSLLQAFSLGLCMNQTEMGCFDLAQWNFGHCKIIEDLEIHTSLWTTLCYGFFYGSSMEDGGKKAYHLRLYFNDSHERFQDGPVVP